MNDLAVNFQTLNTEPRSQQTLLMQAARYGDLVGLEEELPEASVNARNSDGNNALWFACFSNNPKAVQFLIDQGIDIDNQNDNGATALIYSASAGKAEVVELLLDAGADTSLMTLDDFTALELAANRKIMQLLRQHNAKSK